MDFWWFCFTCGRFDRSLGERLQGMRKEFVKRDGNIAIANDAMAAVLSLNKMGLKEKQQPAALLRVRKAVL
jgi:hypothetical protein